MIALILSVVSSTLIFVVFKLFSKFNINTLHAIIVNYIVACLCGVIAFDAPIALGEVITLDWFYYAICLGALFIIVFNLMAATTQRSGLSVVSVATKMSFIIPIIFGLLYYKEALGVFKAIGILLAICAVYLSSIKTKSGIIINRGTLLLPVLVFLGSGIIDTSIKFLEESYVAKNEIPIFSSTLFASAASIGFGIIIFQMVRGNFTFEFKNVLGGIALGVPNYFSIYFLVQALRSGIFDSSGIFTVNNVAIVMASTIVGILLFREKLLFKNWIGIVLAISSIIFVALENYL